MFGDGNYTYQYHRGYHVRVGVDSYLNDKGSPFMKQDGHPGVAMENCEIILNLLGWTYEYVFYDKELGQANPSDPKASTGKLTIQLFMQSHLVLKE